MKAMSGCSALPRA
ncbi:hypothetical protein H4Q32_021817 [Labeo rohita]|uniref:Uncharacterized protein n=1 Tax=Labeo rohita TaxID=84645 RepID=A0ABQ8MUD7_LABRO|nr:hypothetical protein H4Q32_021817 [Labeo rohita]